MLHLKTFGGLSVAVDDAPGGGARQQRKTLGLLGLLAAAGRTRLRGDRAARQRRGGWWRLTWCGRVVAPVGRTRSIELTRRAAADAGPRGTWRPGRGSRGRACA